LELQISPYWGFSRTACISPNPLTAASKCLPELLTDIETSRIWLLRLPPFTHDQPQGLSILVICVCKLVTMPLHWFQQLTLYRNSSINNSWPSNYTSRNRPLTDLALIESQFMITTFDRFPSLATINPSSSDRTPSHC
jgi:hypothetical protein